MPSPNSPKTLLATLIFLLFVTSLLASFLAQTPEPSPSPSGSPSPSPSPSPTRSPSPTPLPGAQNFHQWGSITVFNGLPSDSVRAIAQTPDGIMWFGTDNGLARFDGRRIQRMTFGDQDETRILALKTSPTGDLWIGTSSGAFVFTNDRFQSIGNTQEAGINTITFGSSVFLGTDTGFVLRVNVDLAERLFPEPIRKSDGTAVVVTGVAEVNGRLLAGTAGRGMFVVKDGIANPLPLASSPSDVNSIATGVRGVLWLGADAPKGVSGIYSAEADAAKAVRILAPTARVLALEANESGIWAGTERYGLFQIVGGKVEKAFTFENTSGGLRSDNIFTLFTDREGVLWIGTNRGASRFDRQGTVQQTVSDIPNSNFIRELFHYGEGHVLYAGSNRGLFKSNEEGWERVPALGDRSVYCISARVGNPDSIIVGTSTGAVDLGGRTFLDGDVRSFGELNGRIYAAVYGRGVVDVTDRSRPRVVFANEAVTSLGGYVEKLWIGTSGLGLFSFDGANAKLEASPETLKSGTIWSVGEAGKGTGVWIAGQHGVFFFKDGFVEKILEAEDVRDVWASPDLGAAAGGLQGEKPISHVWAATTTRGLLHARRDERFGWLVTSIGFEQGLPSEKAFSILPSKEGLMVGTNRGVVDLPWFFVPPKLIAVRVLSQRVHNLAELGSKIDLEYPQNALLVEVAGQSSRTFPEEFQYAFVLKNAKGEEIARQLSNDSQYAPTDLKPGEYAIEAIAFNRDLLGSDPLTISFSVAKAPFPWTATALGVLLFIAVVGLVWAIIEHRRIVQRNRELAAARLDLANEAERERRRIARDLHDQTLADLRNLMMTTDKMPAAGSAVREEIESISTEIRRICEDLSPSVLENVGLVAALESLLSRTIENSKFVAAESLEERIEFPLNTQLQIYRIAQEVVTNIQRHSTATQVEMSVGVPDADEFVLTIRDDGNAFHPDALVSRGRGISNIRARANLINGRVAWKESRRGGNVFSLKVNGSV